MHKTLKVKKLQAKKFAIKKVILGFAQKPVHNPFTSHQRP